MVQRYTLVAPGVLNTDMNTGSWVRYSDYQKLEAELEQLRQQVKAPADDGWIEWAGGKCPCDYGSVVEVRLRGGNERGGRGALSWEWKHYNSICDIIAYRVVKP